ncbi:MAG: hypothetical protein ABI461_21575 [Polyangiaceae bacterium]
MNRRVIAGAGGTLAMLLGIACGGGNDNLPPPPPPPPPPPATASAAPTSAPADAGATAAPPAAAITLTAGTASPDPAAPLPTVKISAPTKGQLIAADKAGDFIVKLDVKNWSTAPGSTHVHLILDGKPYKPIYDPKAPVKLSELAGGDPIGEGQHVLVAFPSRANHESVKTKGALAVLEFYVGKKKGDATVDLKKPMLVYSRPKGVYKGDQGNHVLVDFQLVNDTLADGKDHVSIDVTGTGIDKDLTADVKSFGAPYYLDNLQNGTYTVKLVLLGADGQPVAGTWNSNTRTFSVDHDAQPDAMPAMAMPGASATPAPAGSAKPAKK